MICPGFNINAEIKNILKLVFVCYHLNYFIRIYWSLLFSDEFYSNLGKKYGVIKFSILLQNAKLILTNDIVLVY